MSPVERYIEKYESPREDLPLEQILRQVVLDRRIEQSKPAVDVVLLNLLSHYIGKCASDVLESYLDSAGVDLRRRQKLFVIGGVREVLVTISQTDEDPEIYIRQFIRSLSGLITHLLEQNA